MRQGELKQIPASWCNFCGFSRGGVSSASKIHPEDVGWSGFLRSVKDVTTAKALAQRFKLDKDLLEKWRDKRWQLMSDMERFAGCEIQVAGDCWKASRGCGRSYGAPGKDSCVPCRNLGRSCVDDWLFSSMPHSIDVWNGRNRRI